MCGIVKTKGGGCYMKRLLLVSSVTMMVLVTTTFARTWYVNAEGTGDAPTIQAGLDSAATGDIVLVAAGVYNVDIIFWPDRNGIVLQGAGMGNTIVYGDAWQAILYVANAVPLDTTTVIRHLTLRNGGDAGVILYGASPLMELCQVDSTRGGAGIYAVHGSGARIRMCEIEGNSGPGLRIDGCDSISVEDNNIQGNSAMSGAIVAATRKAYPGFSVGDPVYRGGGIYCLDSFAFITGNKLTYNQAAVGGGAVHCESSLDSVIVAWNEIAWNTSDCNGGGIWCAGRIEISDNTLSGNHGSSGGGIHCDEGMLAVLRNTICDNTAQNGGGINVYNCQSIAISCNRIIGNMAEYGGGGIFFRSPADFSGNLVIRNRASTGAGVYLHESGGLSVISGNRFVENLADSSGGGMYCHVYNYVPTVTGNEFIRNEALAVGGAVMVADCDPGFSYNTIAENSAGSAAGGIYTSGSTMSLSYSNVAHNRWGFHNDDPVNVPVVQQNWWGDASGPWHQGYNPSGQGDSLSPYAWDFQPWLTEPDTLAPPIPPFGVRVDSVVGDAISLSWDPVPLGDLEGYRICFSTDTTEVFHSDTVDVGNVTESTLGSLLYETAYYIAITCYDRAADESWYSAQVTATTGYDAGLTDDLNERTPLALGCAYPNPFGSATRITYRSEDSRYVLLTVHDIHGRRVTTLVSGFTDVGQHTITWNGSDERGQRVASGVYFVRLECNGEVATRRVVRLQ
jgi:hypothetical protein